MKLMIPRYAARLTVTHRHINSVQALTCLSGQEFRKKLSKILLKKPIEEIVCT